MRLKLREVLKAKGMSQGEMSRRSGISLSTIQRMSKEGYNYPALDVLEKIANVLSVPVSDLIDEPRNRK